MQTHKKKIEKRIYTAGEVIEIPIIKRVKKHIYRKATRSFKINSVNGNTLLGEYINV